ncbi:oligogalacturonate lyase [Spirochaetia bacterium]|nr:oligogalacturonate lyase [Spirochaetia bacterium]
MFKTFNDPLTGKKITKLSPNGIICHHPYFYNKMFTSDGRFLIYAQENSGSRNIYSLDLQDGSSKLIASSGDEPLADFGVTLSSDDKNLFYCRGNRIIRQNMKTGETAVLYTAPEGWDGYSNPSFSSDDRYIVTVEIWKEDVIPATGGWDTFEPQWRKNPRCRIVYIDTEKNTSHVVHEEKLWLGHPQIRPRHNGDISFCHEGPATRIDARLWFIKADGTGMVCLHNQKRDEIITHEFWLADGSKLAFVYRKFLTGPDKDGRYGDEVINVKQSIRYANADTVTEEFIMDCSVYCHSITSPDNTLLVGDGQKTAEPFIYLTDLKTKKETILCRHDTKWKSYGNNQDAHPHPAFTPDSKKIVFTSDRDGLPGIYLAEIC